MVSDDDPPPARRRSLLTHAIQYSSSSCAAGSRRQSAAGGSKRLSQPRMSVVEHMMALESVQEKQRSPGRISQPRLSLIERMMGSDGTSGSITEHYTLENLAKRADLRNDPEVQQVLDLWWTTAIQASRSGAQSVAVSADAERSLSRQQYILMSQKLYRALVEEYDEKEAIKQANEDWQRDCRGCKELPKDYFQDAMFELADLYTNSIEAGEYAKFLREVFQCIAKVRPLRLVGGLDVVPLPSPKPVTLKHSGLVPPRRADPRTVATPWLAPDACSRRRLTHTGSRCVSAGGGCKLRDTRWAQDGANPLSVQGRGLGMESRRGHLLQRIPARR